jgi:ferric-dicitrate binding protein FerR (iron transport regulator)
MNTTFRMTVMAAALGILSGLAAAQEQGATTASEPVAATTAAHVDNGAMPGDSHVRIVRLSDVKGNLALDRKTGLGFEQTMQNMPIVEGEKLKTEDGYAEVEFEDNTTMRLAPNSQVDFSLLALRSSGAKASTMNVVKGTVYVNTEGTKGNEFLLVAGDMKVTVAPSTHLRMEVNESRTVVSVFNGNAEVQRGAETTTLGKKQSWTLSGDQATMAKKVQGAPYDDWDKESIDYHKRYAAANAAVAGGSAFGLSDLNYYGSFINAGGASFWQPYFVGAGWSPYANGVWAFYPGAGYSWVSPYPWGWLPYHSGSWSFFPGYGWGWQPGGSWNGLNNVGTNGTIATGTMPTGSVPAGSVPANGAGGNPMHSPIRSAAVPPPPAAAGGTRQSLVMTNEKPIVYSRQDQSGNFVFQKDSAGLGVPRGSLGNLNHVNNDVGRHGSASMPVYAAGPNGAEGNVHGATRGPSTLRPAYGGEGPQGVRGNEAASAARQGGWERTGGVQGVSPSSHGGGGGAPSAGGAAAGGASAGAPAGGAGAGGGGAARGPVMNPR